MITLFKNYESIKQSKGQVRGNRFSDKDLSLIYFGEEKQDVLYGELQNNVEFSVYDMDDNLLHWSDLGMVPYEKVLPANFPHEKVIYYPGNVLRAAGFTRGQYRIVYNIFRNVLGDPSVKKLFIQDISPSRKEVRILPAKLPDSSVNDLNVTQFKEFANFINDDLRKLFFGKLLLNFGDNNTFPIINFIKDAVTFPDEPYSIVLKLYEPLPDDIEKNFQCWISIEQAPSVIETVMLYGPEIPKIEGIYLKPANFNIDINDISGRPTPYESWNDLVGSDASISEQIISKYLSASLENIDLNIDYSDYTNFVHFGSAKERIDNFKYKMQLLESYNTQLSNLQAYSSSMSPSSSIVATNNINAITLKKRYIINNLDSYERFLYYTSGSQYSGSVPGIENEKRYHAIHEWPKITSNYPFVLANSTSSVVTNWYATQSAFATEFDNNNLHSLMNYTPIHIRVNIDNEEYLLFLNMIGQYYDYFYTYINQLNKLHDRNEDIYRGLSKELTYHVAKSFGFDLYNGNDYTELWSYALGVNETGSLSLGSNAIINGTFSDHTLDAADDDVVAYWIFDDVYHTANNTGYTASQDLMGTGLNFIPVGFSSSYVGQMVSGSIIYEGGNTLKFNGTGQFLRLLNPSVLEPRTGDWTIEVWYKTPSSFASPALQPIVDHGGSFGPTNIEYALTLNTAGNIRFGASDGSVVWIDANVLKYAATVNTWYYIAVSIDRDGEQALYINGDKVASQAISNSVDFDINENLYIGALRNGAFSYYNKGNVAAFRYSNVARTATEIKANYTLQKKWRNFSKTGSIEPSHSVFSQQFTNTTSSDGAFYQKLTSIPTGKYRLQFDGQVVSGPDSSALVVEVGGVKTVTTSSVLNTVTNIFTTTKKDSKIKIYGSGSSLSSVYYIDNIALQQYTSIANAPVSYEDVTSEIWRRILNNLPYLFKTKGTTESIRTLLSCYGIPTSMLVIREYGGPDPLDYPDIQDKSAYVFDDFVYSIDFSGSYIYTDWVDYAGASAKPNTLEFRFKSTDWSNSTQSMVSVDSNWGISLRSTSTTKRGNRLGYIAFELNNQVATSSHFSFYDGNFYSVILRLTGSNHMLSVKRAENGRILYQSSDSIATHADYQTDGNLYIGGSAVGTFGSNFSGSMQEFRLFSSSLYERTIDNHVRWPKSYNSNDVTSSYTDLLLRYSFDEPKNHSEDTVVSDVKANRGLTAYTGTAVNFTDEINYTAQSEEFFALTPNIGLSRLYNNKIRIESSILRNALSSTVRAEEGQFDRAPLDSNKVGIYFSPVDTYNRDIIATFAGSDLTSYIGSPGDLYKDNYADLEVISRFYWSKYGSSQYNYNDFIRVLNRYDHSFFEQVRKLLPARVNPIIGILIEPTILERSKIKHNAITVEQPLHEVTLKNFRPYTTASIDYRESTLIIGDNWIPTAEDTTIEVTVSTIWATATSHSEVINPILPMQETVSSTSSYYRTSIFGSNYMSRIAYRGSINTDETTIDGRPVIETIITNPNKLFSTEYGPSKLRVE